MKCEFEYCIYNRGFECIIDEPKIDSLGMCGACIVISLDQDLLKNEKEKQFLEIESRWIKSIGDNENERGSRSAALKNRQVPAQ